MQMIKGILLILLIVISILSKKLFVYHCNSLLLKRLKWCIGYDRYTSLEQRFQEIQNNLCVSSDYFINYGELYVLKQYFKKYTKNLENLFLSDLLVPEYSLLNKNDDYYFIITLLSFLTKSTKKESFDTCDKSVYQTKPLFCGKTLTNYGIVCYKLCYTAHLYLTSYHSAKKRKSDKKIACFHSDKAEITRKILDEKSPKNKEWEFFYKYPGDNYHYRWFETITDDELIKINKLLLEDKDFDTTNELKNIKERIQHQIGLKYNIEKENSEHIEVFFNPKFLKN